MSVYSWWPLTPVERPARHARDGPREATKRKPAGGRPKADDPKRSLASLKGGVKYSEWSDGLVGHSHLPATILIEHALREYAENHGHDGPQSRR